VTPAAGPDAALIEGVLAGDRRALAKAITLVESSRHDQQDRGQALIEALLPHTGRSLRIGISGVPGAGKSTFIESLGLHIIGQGHRLAVLAVDPTSSLSGGAILGDKTRMQGLARAPAAFIRPSPAGACPGGVAARTREAMLLCEAAGFDVVIVETMGVGQAETAVARMTDLLVLLQLPLAGDGLQAIKKGILELADLIVITKSDLAPAAAAAARQTLADALTMLRPASPHWQPPVLTLSARDGGAVAAVWSQIERYRQTQCRDGAFERRRRSQSLDWMWHLIEEGLRADFRAHPAVGALLPDIAQGVSSGTLSPTLAATRLLTLAQTNRAPAAAPPGAPAGAPDPDCPRCDP
jgi:LAO/AO transport system kinase